MRFNRPAYPTVYFSEKIWVKCPNCSERASVLTELPKYTIPFPTGHKSVCHCSFCGFQDTKNDKWFGYFQGYINRACGHCGSKISHTTKPTKKPYKSTEITCGVCKSAREYENQWYKYSNEIATDPYFGLDLWLQVNIKDNILWLYNIDHLDYLKEYVSAKLREDDGRYKYSIITNLPQWVKKSKNRVLIVKKLNKLKLEFEKG